MGWFWGRGRCGGWCGRARAADSGGGCPPASLGAAFGGRLRFNCHHRRRRCPSVSSFLLPSYRGSLVKVSWAVLVNAVEWVLCRGEWMWVRKPLDMNGLCFEGELDAALGQGGWLRLLAVLPCVQGVLRWIFAGLLAGQ